MMLYRSSYYNRGTGDGEDGAVSHPDSELEEAEILIAKHRNGPTGTVRLGFIRKYAMFSDLDEIHQE